MDFEFSFWLAQEQQQQQQQSGNSSKKSKRRDVGNEENADEYVDPETPCGEKKKFSAQMAKQYSPTAVEKSLV